MKTDSIKHFNNDLKKIADQTLKQEVKQVIESVPRAHRSVLKMNVLCSA